MKTENFIRALVADQPARTDSIERRCAMALLPALALAALLFALSLGPRPDFAVVATDPRFVFKFVVMLTLAATALMLVCRLARPGAGTGLLALALAAGPVLLGLGVLVELVSVPSAAWSAKLVGTNARICLTFIPIFAAPLLLAALIALRYGAPTRPALTGAVAGLLAGGLGAALYAAHCTDDSPLFVATWYSIAIGAVAIVGMLLGNKILRW
jgi:hypothetical protein